MVIPARLSTVTHSEVCEQEVKAYKDERIEKERQGRVPQDATQSIARWAEARRRFPREVDEPLGSECAQTGHAGKQREADQRERVTSQGAADGRIKTLRVARGGGGGPLSLGGGGEGRIGGVYSES